jgi:hypothetical protein
VEEPDEPDTLLEVLLDMSALGLDPVLGDTALGLEVLGLEAPGVVARGAVEFDCAKAKLEAPSNNAALTAAICTLFT